MNQQLIMYNISSLVVENSPGVRGKFVYWNTENLGTKSDLKFGNNNSLEVTGEYILG